MLDHLDCMLNAPETSCNRTIVPLLVMESCPCRADTTPVLSSLSSYTIGPIDPVHLVTMHISLSCGEHYSLFLPVPLPPSILRDPAFRDGHLWNFLSEEEREEEAQEWTSSVPRLVNHLHSSLTDWSLWDDPDTGEVRPDWLPWQVGWLLRDLARLAQRDRTLALVGLAHVRFLLLLLTGTRPADWPRYEAFHASLLHNHAVKAFRGRVRVYRAQGASYEKAQRLVVGACTR